MVNIINVLLEVVIFGAIIGTIATTVATGSNLSGTALILYSLVTLFVVIGFIMTLMKTLGLKKGR